MERMLDLRLLGIQALLARMQGLQEPIDNNYKDFYFKIKTFVLNPGNSIGLCPRQIGFEFIKPCNTIFYSCQKCWEEVFNIQEGFLKIKKEGEQ